MEFCTQCGSKLTTGQNHKKYIAVIATVLIAMVILGACLWEYRRMQDTKQEIEDYKYEKAVQEYKSTPTTSDLEINDGWTIDISGGYLYINGSVTNVSSSKTISYFEIGAKFYDEDKKVIDSDWTNDGDDLSPGETRSFEIMHKNDAGIESVKLYVKEVD